MSHEVDRPNHGAFGPQWSESPFCYAGGDEGGNRETVVRGVPAEGGGASGGAGERDDKTRVRMPAVGSGAGSGRAANADATRHVKREGAGKTGKGGRSGRTMRMEVVPERFGWLVVKKGARVGHVYRLDPEVTDLGRGADNDIVIDDEKVSEEHTRVRVDEEGQFVVWDLASTNGTFVNGERITAATPVVENDEVRVGHTVLVLKTLDLGES